MAFEDDLDFTNAFYLMMTTTSTVGFGNVVPKTTNGKIFISFYQLIPIGCFFGGLTLLASK